MRKSKRKIYVLHHVRDEGLDSEDVKLIGVYSSKRAAADAVDRLGQQPGFREYRAGFQYEAYALNEDHWKEGFV